MLLADADNKSVLDMHADAGSDGVALAGVALAGQVDRHHGPVLLQVVLGVAPECDSSNTKDSRGTTYLR